MSIAFYMDHHVPRAITVGLRLRGVEVLLRLTSHLPHIGEGVDANIACISAGARRRNQTIPGLYGRVVVSE